MWLTSDSVIRDILDRAQRVPHQKARVLSSDSSLSAGIVVVLDDFNSVRVGRCEERVPRMVVAELSDQALDCSRTSQPNQTGLCFPSQSPTTRRKHLAAGAIQPENGDCMLVTPHKAN